MSRYVLLLSFFLSLPAFAQPGALPDSMNLPNSENGWYLSPHGTIRILVLFAEVDYDVHPEKDPGAGGGVNWPKG